MDIIADLHIHSKFARSCSNRLDVENIFKSCIIKGIDIIGTGDFTHPSRLVELQTYLESDNNGFLIPSKQYLDKWIEDIRPYLHDKVYQKVISGYYPRFVLQTEINNVFQRGEKKYRVHNCFLIDSLEGASQIMDYLSGFGNVESDGRLAVRQDQTDTLVWLKTNFPQLIYFPGHIWTPHFGVLGSRLHFKSIKDAYGEATSLIDAIETGLSSDPFMNFINAGLDDFSILSNSDAHSPENFAREANVFVSKKKGLISYKDLEKAIKYRKSLLPMEKLHNIERDYIKNLFVIKNTLELKYTIEFYPQEGKYFADGHSKCYFCTTPSDTIKRSGRCPVCGGKITIGVLHRAFELGDNQRIEQSAFGTKDFWNSSEIDNISADFHRPNFRYIVPLWDIIREVFSANKGTKKSENIYNELIKNFGTEFDILLNLDVKKAKEYNKFFGRALEKVRNSDITIKPGYDGNFGVVSIKEVDDLGDIDSKPKQDTLF